MIYATGFHPDAGALAGLAVFGVLLVGLVVFVVRFTIQLVRTGRRPPPRPARLDVPAAPALDDHADERGQGQGEAEDRAPEPEDER